MELFKYEIRQDWQEHDRLVSSSQHHLWRVAQLITLFAAILCYAIGIANLRWPWSTALQSGLSSAVFLSFALWVVHREGRSGKIAALVLSALLLACGFATALSKPSAPGQSGLLPIQFAGLAGLVIWVVCLWSWRSRPEEMRLAGFHFRHWAGQILLGLAAGASLGLHFMLTANHWLDRSVALDNPQYSLWALLFLIGVSAPAEEFFLRGAAFRLLYDESESSYWQVAFQISLINLLIYLVPLYFMSSNGIAPWIVIWILLYRLAYSLTVTFLRQQRASLLACIACNLVFNGVMMVFFPW